jgi:hypothetical protein
MFKNKCLKRLAVNDCNLLSGQCLSYAFRSIALMKWHKTGTGLSSPFTVG